MDVGVLEAGQEQPAGQVDDPRPRPNVGRDVRRGPHGHDPLAAHGDSLCARPGVVDRVDVAARQDEVGGSFGVRHAHGGCHRPGGACRVTAARGTVRACERSAAGPIVRP